VSKYADTAPSMRYLSASLDVGMSWLGARSSFVVKSSWKPLELSSSNMRHLWAWSTVPGMNKSLHGGA
jgi:hypothetical protein